MKNTVDHFNLYEKIVSMLEDTNQIAAAKALIDARSKGYTGTEVCALMRGALCSLQRSNIDLSFSLQQQVSDLIVILDDKLK
jgi:hypothetical protein